MQYLCLLGGEIEKPLGLNDTIFLVHYFSFFPGIDMGNGIVRYKAEVDVGKSIFLSVFLFIHLQFDSFYENSLLDLCLVNL